MKKSCTKLIIILVVLASTLTLLGPVTSLTPFIYAQIPLIPGQATPPPPPATKANTTSPPATQSNVTTPKTTPSPTPAPTSAIPRLNFTNASGTIASLQNNQLGKPHGTWAEQFVRSGIWLLSGKWSLSVPSASANKTTSTNMTSPTFDASFSMVLLNGTAKHSHKISDFRMVGNPVINSTGNSTTFRGTATVTLKDGPHTNVPVVITLIDKSVIRIGIDPLKTDNHFGPTPIFGSMTKLS